MHLTTVAIKPIGFLYSSVNNNKYNFIAFLFDNEIELRVKSEEISEDKIKEISKKFNKSIFIKKNISEEELINKFILNNTFEIDDRIKNIKKKLYNNESYELFRLEFSNFINQNKTIKEKIMKIIESSKISKKEKVSLLKNIIFKNINNDIYNTLQKGGNEKFVNINNNSLDLSNYNINNKRNLCNIHENKEDCNKNLHCKFSSNKCLFNISLKKSINFVSKIIDELLSDEMKSKEILKQDNYFITDIVDDENYIERENEKIIKDNNPDFEKILSQYLGNIPYVKNRKKNKQSFKNINQIINENPLEEKGDFKIQNIIINNYTIVRAFINSYYWKKNDLKTEELRNLNYYSELQTNLTNYFIGKIVDFINNNNNNEYLQNTFSYLNFNNFDIIINDMDNMLFNGRITLCILSKILNETVIVFNNFLKVLYICENGEIYYDLKYNIISNYENKLKERDYIGILFDLNFNTEIISKIKSIYF